MKLIFCAFHLIHSFGSMFPDIIQINCKICTHTLGSNCLLSLHKKMHYKSSEQSPTDFKMKADKAHVSIVMDRQKEAKKTARKRMGINLHLWCLTYPEYLMSTCLEFWGSVQIHRLYIFLNKQSDSAMSVPEVAWPAISCHLTGSVARQSPRPPHTKPCLISEPCRVLALEF